MGRASVREEIVDSALVEFHRRGFNGCSVEDITKAAGVPKGSFYNHFASKEDLGAEVVRRYSAATGFRAEVDSALSPLTQLRARFEASRVRLVGYGFARGCLLVNMGAEVSDHYPAIRAEVESSLDSWAGQVAYLLRSARACGELSTDADLDGLARLIVDAWEGAVNRAKIVQGPQPFDDFFTVVFGSLLR